MTLKIIKIPLIQSLILFPYLLTFNILSERGRNITSQTMIQLCKDNKAVRWTLLEFCGSKLYYKCRMDPVSVCGGVWSLPYLTTGLKSASLDVISTPPPAPGPMFGISYKAEVWSVTAEQQERCSLPHCPSCSETNIWYHISCAVVLGYKPKLNLSFRSAKQNGCFCSLKCNTFLTKSFP